MGSFIRRPDCSEPNTGPVEVCECPDVKLDSLTNKLTVSDVGVVIAICLPRGREAPALRKAEITFLNERLLELENLKAHLYILVGTRRFFMYVFTAISESTMTSNK
jgi:hypothetical protein